MGNWRSAFWAGFLASACGGGDSSLDPFERSYAETELSLSPLELRPERTVTLPGPAAVFGTNGNGLPVVSLADGTVYALNAEGFERRRLYAGPGDPVFLGAIRDLGARAEGGTWLAADAGLFVVDTQYILPIAPLGPVLQVEDARQGALSGLWLVTANALLLALEGELATFEIPDLLGPHRALAISPDGSRGLTIAGGEPLLLVPDGLDLDVFTLPFEVTARSVASTRDGLWMSADEGLFLLPEGRSSWLGLEAEGAPLVVGPLESDDERIYASRNDDLILLEMDGAEVRAQVAAGHGDRLVAPDGNGGFWLATPDRAEGYRLSSTTRFARDVVPFLDTHCAQCHGEGPSDYRVFENFSPRAEAALTRIRSGDMPRCGVGQVRCPESEHLTPESYAVLETWIAGGKLP